MKDFLNAVKLLVVDLQSTLFFLALFFVTHKVVVSGSLAMPPWNVRHCWPQQGVDRGVP